MKVTQRAVTKARSGRLCWYPSAGQVVVDVTAEAVAHVSQVHRCGSPWSCPVCAPVVRNSRAQEVDAGVSGHLAAGGGVEFLTVTVPHYAQNALAPRLLTIRRALGAILSGRPWQKRREALGYVGSIRAVEVTYGVNGWHPHLHAVMLFDGPLTPAERADLLAWITGRWAGIVAAKGYGRLNGRHGVDLRPVTSAEDLGEYVTKVEGGWTAGLELVRGDLKSGKGMSPFQVLYELAATGEVRWRDLWQEYEQATFGAAALMWSPGLRARLLGQEADESDVERAAAECSGVTVLRVLLEAESWRREVRAGTVGLVLNEIEDTAALVLGLLRCLGHEVRPLRGAGGGGDVGDG